MEAQLDTYLMDAEELDGFSWTYERDGAHLVLPSAGEVEGFGDDLAVGFERIFGAFDLDLEGEGFEGQDQAIAESGFAFDADFDGQRASGELFEDHIDDRRGNPDHPDVRGKKRSQLIGIEFVLAWSRAGFGEVEGIAQEFFVGATQLAVGSSQGDHEARGGLGDLDQLLGVFEQELHSDGGDPILILFDVAVQQEGEAKRKDLQEQIFQKRST